MFRVGQKVVCVDDGGPGQWAPESRLTVGGVYTIKELGRAVADAPGVRLFERVLSSQPGRVGSFSKKPFSDNFYMASRFRPVVERKTDISIFTKMLTPKTRRVQERA